MSVVNTSGEKVLLPRTGDLREAMRTFAGENPSRWKGLACLNLSLQGWPLERIGLVVGHSKGHVTRLIERTQQALVGLIDPDEPTTEDRDLASAT